MAVRQAQIVALHREGVRIGVMALPESQLIAVIVSVIMVMVVTENEPAAVGMPEAELVIVGWPEAEFVVVGVPQAEAVPLAEPQTMALPDNQVVGLAEGEIGVLPENQIVVGHEFATQ